MTESECLPVISPTHSLQQQQQQDTDNYRTTLSSDSTPLQAQDTLPTASKVDSTQTTSVTSTPKTLHVRIVPNIENPSRALIFEILDRELAAGSVIKLGRFTDRPSGCVECMSFKSKVVSRSHCEIWVHSDGKVRSTKDQLFNRGCSIQQINSCTFVTQVRRLARFSITSA